MDIWISAVLGEMTSRSINFLISKSFKKPTTAPELEKRLHRVLLRAQVIFDEAMGRNITNHAMLQQLNMLRDAMHRGYYMLDTFRYQHACCDDKQKEDTKDHQVVVSHCSSPSSSSKLISLKGLCCSSTSSSTSAQVLKQLQKAVDDLSSMILDMEELVKFLAGYPRIYRQPYSMHLILSNCMFGRHMEAQLIINFLLHTQPDSSKEPEVLPIVGPGKVGKSTLVAHVCRDQRVRDHFSEILLLHEHDFTQGCGAVKHQNRRVLNLNNKEERLLIVVELVGDLSEDAWNMLHSYYKRRMTNSCKIIVTSRSDTIIKLGTTRALTLESLSHEAYWYFFKTLAFGSIDPERHPRLMHLAMEISGTLNSCIIGGNITASLLRENFDVHFWSKVLSFLRWSFQRHESRFGDNPSRALNQDRPAHLVRMGRTSEEVTVHPGGSDELSLHEEVPKIRLQDVVYGSINPSGKFKALVWSSTIPPYHSYVYTCEIQQTKPPAAKRKRGS